MDTQQSNGQANGADPAGALRNAMVRRDPSTLLARGSEDVTMARVLKDRKGRAMVREREREVVDARLRAMVIYEKGRDVVAVTVGINRLAMQAAVQIDSDWTDASNAIHTMAAMQAINETTEISARRLPQITDRTSSLADEVLLGHL